MTEKKVLFITGAAIGIGHAACLKFAAQGYAVAFNDYNQENGRKAEQELKAMGYDVLFLPGDATSEEEVKAMVAKTVETYGRIDTLINNAGGLGGRSAFEGMETPFWNRVMDLNLTGAFFASRECIPWLKKTKGTIINITSIAAYNGGGPGAGVYAAAKAAVLTMTRAMAKELIPAGVRVNAVSPGTIDTAFHAASSRELLESFVKAIPAGRMGRPGEVADVMYYLASEQSSYLVGEVVQINGGQMML
ncbi:MAG: SDR family oxidoreductase [Lachnospiraceae bacterium]|nr:SDR family oxidoreductase [Lachnospiraceae bacterium]